jgi:hypothetical protein
MNEKDKKMKMDRKLRLNGKEISIRFYYGEPNEKNPKLSYTKVVNFSHASLKGKHNCRFVECRIEECVNGKWTPIVTSESICSPNNRFLKIQGRSLAIRRAVEKLGLDSATARMVRVYGLGSAESIKRYNKLHGIVMEDQEEKVSV